VPGSQPGAADPAARRLAEAAVLAVVVLWAANFVVVKAVLADVPPLVFTGLRYVVASVTVLALLQWREGSIGLPRRDLLILVGLGVTGFAAYQMLWTIGLTQITAGDSALLIATTPVLVAVIAAAMGTDTLTPPKVVGAVVSFGGVALVIGGGKDFSLGTSLTGDLLTLAAAVAWAVYTSLGAKVVRRISPLKATAWSVTGGMLALVPLAGWQAATSAPFGLQLPHALAMLYSGFFAAGVANIAILHGVKVLGPTRVTVLQYGVPPIAVALGALVLHEPIRPAQVLGGVIIVLGVVITRRTRGSRDVRLPWRRVPAP
jgi:drug/metabolite transporter (DMT)-like permease